MRRLARAWAGVSLVTLSATAYPAHAEPAPKPAETTAHPQPPPSQPPPSQPPPSAVEEGRRRFQRGMKFAKDGDFRSALVEFEEANRVAPSYRIYYNIGQTSENMQDFAGAMAAFRRYLDEGGAAVPKARRGLVEDELKQLEGHVARLEVQTSEADVEIIAEGERKISLGRTPLAEPALLNSGDWEITARKDGFEPRVEHVILAGGDRRKLVLTMNRPEPLPPPVLVRPAPAAITTPTLTPAPPPPSPSMAPVWIGAGLTGALAISAGVTGGLFLGAKSDYTNKLGTFGESPTAISQASSNARTLALAADIQTGCAIAVGVATVIVYVVRRQGHSSGSSTRAWSPVVSPTGVAFAF